MSKWENIKSRLRVEDVISEYVEIYPAGAYYKCVCPFHNEKTPSLMISPERNIWHCFGCGAGGDIFQFVQDFENISAKESLKKLAEKAGIPLQEASNNKNQTKNTSEASELEQGFKLLEWSAEIYHKILMRIIQDRNHPITKYCLQRGMNQKILETFKIGYAPKGDFLYTLCSKHSIDLMLISKIGLLKTNSQNKYKDKFMDRLMIPIHNEQGMVVGFTGRVLPGQKNLKRPKYLNSAGSDWFNKAGLWFGLHLAKRAVYKHKKAIIVEGNMDVIAAYAHDLKHTIAAQGTSVTEEQIKILSKITSNPLLAFDNDEAGRIAGEKFFKKACTYGLTVDKVLIPKEFKDLDEYIFSNDFTHVQTIPYLEYILSTYTTELTGGDVHIKKQTISHILELFSSVDKITAEIYVTRLSTISDIHKETLWQIYEKEQQGNVTKVKKNKPLEQSVKQNPYSDILVAFQKLILSDNTSEKLLDKLYIILQIFLPKLQKYDSYSLYKKHINPEILLAKESGHAENTIESSLIINSIIVFLDKNISKFILDEERKTLYQEIKKELLTATNI